MTEKKSRPPRRSEPDAPAELKQQRDAFVQTFFKKGAELTEELLRENERLRHQAMELEQQNEALKTQLRSDEAIREALRKIEQLEREKELLLNRFTEKEAATSRFSARFQEIEEELANMANLYVASYQLHSTLALPMVVKHLRELLAQLVGARSHSIYIADHERRQLVPVASDGVDRDTLPRVQLEAGAAEAPQGAAAIAERVFLTGVARVEEGSLAAASLDAPAACLPLRIEDRMLGVIVIYTVLAQKERFVPVDYELFNLLGAHAATALVSAMLYAAAGGVLPGLDAFRDLEDARGLLRGGVPQ